MWYTSQECAFYIFAHTNSDQAKQKMILHPPTLLNRPEAKSILTLDIILFILLSNSKNNGFKGLVLPLFYIHERNRIYLLHVVFIIIRWVVVELI